MARCPAHEDRSPSLSIREGRDGRVLLKCFAGCTVEAICAALKLPITDLFARRGDRPHTVPRALHERAESAAWRISDEIGRLRRYYMDGLHRAERLEAHIGDGLLRESTEAARETGWERLARLAPVSMFFFVAFEHVYRLETVGLIRLAGMAPAERRAAILREGEPANAIAA